MRSKASTYDVGVPSGRKSADWIENSIFNEDLWLTGLASTIGELLTSTIDSPHRPAYARRLENALPLQGGADDVIRHDSGRLSKSPLSPPRRWPCLSSEEQ